jgi:tetratricopeptide (TPR) repeat protein
MGFFLWKQNFLNAAANLDEAKKQYAMALQTKDPVAHYKAALEELDAATARDPNLFQAYAIKGLIYRNLEDFEQAIQNFEIAKLGNFGGMARWVPVVMDLTHGDIFHLNAVESIQAGEGNCKGISGNGATIF